MSPASRPGSTRRVTLVLALAAFAPLGGPGPLRKVLRRQAAHDQRTQVELVAGLAALAPDAVPELYALALGRNLDELTGEEWVAEQWLCGPDEMPGLALQALTRVPVKVLNGHLELALASDPPEPERLVMLRLLAAQGSAEGLALALRIGAELGEFDLERPSVGTAVREALTAILLRDARAFPALERDVDALPPVLAALVVEAVGDTGRAQGMRSLARLFGREAPASELVAEAMARLERARPWELQGRTLARCATWWDSQDPARRACMARLAGSVHALDAVPDLIEKLGDSDALVRRCAVDALQSMSDRPLGADEPAWAAWYARELAWEDARWDALLETLVSGAPGEANEALRELAQHPLYRHEAARVIADSLDEQGQLVALAACAELHRLGSRMALPGLVTALEGTQPKLRAAVWRALRGITGEEREISVASWRNWIEG